MRATIQVVTLALGVLAFACGGGSSSSSTATTAPVTRPAAGTTTPAGAAASTSVNTTTAAGAAASGGGNTTSSATNNVKLHLTVTGDYKGQPVQGSVVPANLQCTPVANGDKQGLQVVWGGTVNGVGQVSGDMQFAGGLPPIAFGDGKSQGTASLVVKGDYQNRYGASSALGSGTAQANPDNSGTIDAELDGDTAGKIHLQGSWTC